MRTDHQPYKTLLSLDGGGIRGLISARILEEIETRAGKGIHQLFDLIVGTSTGGILAAGLARPMNGKDGPVPARELVELYCKNGGKIFHRSFWDRLGDFLFGDEKYDVEPLERILKQRLGDTELKCTVPDIVVTSYDIESREPYLFKTRTAREDKDRNHPLRVVARATSAAPTFFEPLLLGKGEGRALIDGGVFASNPSMTALAEAVSSGAKLDEILSCLSLNFHP